MDIKQERKGIKKEVAAYLLVATIMFISIFILHWLFIIPTAVFEFMAFRTFKKFKNINDVQENLEVKQINQEGNKMEKTKEEKTLLLETLSKDEEMNLFLKVTNGQAKFAVFEKLRAELETKPAKEKIEPPTPAAKEEEDIVLEE